MFFLLLCDLSFIEYWIVVLVIVADELEEEELFIWTHLFLRWHWVTSGHVLHTSSKIIIKIITIIIILLLNVIIIIIIISGKGFSTVHITMGWMPYPRSHDMCGMFMKDYNQLEKMLRLRHSTVLLKGKWILNIWETLHPPLLSMDSHLCLRR